LDGDDTQIKDDDAIDANNSKHSVVGPSGSILPRPTSPSLLYTSAPIVTDILQSSGISNNNFFFERQRLKGEISTVGNFFPLKGKKVLTQPY
jgi:hypothetical protein